MKRRRRSNNSKDLLYIFAIVFAIVVISKITEYIVPILIICAIVGLIIGIVALYKCFGIIKPTSSEHQKKTSHESPEEKTPKEDNTKEQTSYQSQTPIDWEVRYKVAEDLPAQNINYRKKPLLTDHERKFYYSLAPIAKKYDLCILSKIRIADLVEPTAHVYKERSEYFHYFGKIKAKHIDFALCDPEDLEVKLLIELDDWTHGTAKGRERDEFVEEVYRDTGYRLLRVYGI